MRKINDIDIFKRKNKKNGPKIKYKAPKSNKHCNKKQMITLYQNNIEKIGKICCDMKKLLNNSAISL